MFGSDLDSDDMKKRGKILCTECWQKRDVQLFEVENRTGLASSSPCRIFFRFNKLCLWLLIYIIWLFLFV